MSDLRELYQEMILEHSKHPRNCVAMEDAECQSDGHNPLCGDRVRVYLRTRVGQIDEISFEGSGCAISMASASMMTEALRGKSVLETERLFKLFHELLTGREGEEDLDALGKLRVFSGVQEFPVRVKCATLAWHTLMAALEHRQETISTDTE